MKIVENRNKFFTASLIFFVIGFAFMAVNAIRGVGAFNYDVEFTGGTSINVDIGKSFTNEEITQLVKDSTGIEKPQVQKILGTNQVNIKTKSLEAETRIKLVNDIKEKYGVDDGAININDVSAVISSEMQTKAIMAVGVACIAMLIYITIRFRDFYTGSSAILALLHDAIAVVCTYAIFRIPLNYSFIAVVLTILGYSINATIIIFDRVRENKKLMRRPTKEELYNTSVNQTLARSINTTITTMLTVLSLFIFGVPDIKDFSLPILVGIICGTYSSVFLSSSILYVLTSRKRKIQVQQ